MALRIRAARKQRAFPVLPASSSDVSLRSELAVDESLCSLSKRAVEPIARGESPKYGSKNPWEEASTLRHDWRTDTQLVIRGGGRTAWSMVG